jgi:UDP-N-acetylmuramoylalanine--D-glutamate ligase
VIEVSSFRGKTVGVFGLARSGLSAIEALKAGGAGVFAWDDRESGRDAAAEKGARIENWTNWPWDQIGALILSPGVPFTHPEPHPIVRRARSSGVEVIGDVELFARAIRPKTRAKGQALIVAITGTNGKSTTTALIAHVLKTCGFDAQAGGNIGRAALDLPPPKASTIYVLEVSSYQIDLSPGLVADVALLTNLSPDHLDRHGSMQGYAAVKQKLLTQVADDGWIAVGVDDPDSAAIFTSIAAARGSHAVAVAVGKVLGNGIFVIDGKLYDAWDQSAELVGDLKAASYLPGAHNWQNAALCYAALRRMVPDRRAIMPAMVRFPGLAHRIEEVGRIGKVRFINDSKATNADAASRALACFSDIYWIAGGLSKEGGIASLSSFFPRIRKAYLIGKAAAAFEQTLSGRVPFMEAGDLERAIGAAYEDARNSAVADPVVLLSPACASFDQFRDFEHRGDVFRELVRQLQTALCNSPSMESLAR